MVARISSVTTSPLQPTNSFSARNAAINDSSLARSSGGRWRTAGTLRSMANAEAAGSGCAMTAARRRARHSGAPMSQASTPIATTAIAMSGADATSAVGLLQSLDQLDVVLLRLVARGALQFRPRV